MLNKNLFAASLVAGAILMTCNIALAKDLNY